jgi:phage baseplate assembly protein gpV
MGFLLVFTMHDSEQNRLLNNIATTGTVIEVDAGTGKMRLQIGENQTDWVNIPSGACGALKLWRCPTVGEQFAVLSESGNFGNAVPLVAIPSEAHPNSGTADEIKMEFPSGYFVIDQATGEATLKLNKLTIDVTEVEFTGKVHAQDEISSDTDIKALAISLVQHKHIGVRSGGDVSGAPQ